MINYTYTIYDIFKEECIRMGIENARIDLKVDVMYIIFANEEDMNLYKLSGGEFKDYGPSSSQQLKVEKNSY